MTRRLSHVPRGTTKASVRRASQKVMLATSTSDGAPPSSWEVTYQDTATGVDFDFNSTTRVLTATIGGSYSGGTSITTLGTVTTGTWTASVIGVAYGGTGRASHTAYAVICGGTTTTGAQQSIASVGTAGQVLTSNGAGALPTFETLAASAPADATYVTLSTNGTLTNERVLTGTSNQITVTDNGAGSTVVLSTPQNLHTSATPTFQTLTLNPNTDYQISVTTGLTITYGIAGATAYLVSAKKSRGSVASPTAITTGDDLLYLSGYGYVGATGTYVEAARITFDSTGTIADTTTGVGGIIRFSTRDVGGAITEQASINNVGQLTLTVATGTAPLVISSTTKVSNLNADLLDDQTGSYYLDSANFTGTNWTDLTDGGATTLHTHAAYLNKDGSVALTANWDAGSFEIRAETFESDVVTGTAPLAIASTTVCTNLNADKVDGKDETAFLLADGTRGLSADWDAGSVEIRAQTFESDVATGTAPLVIASTTLVTNLNADLLDSQSGAYYLDSANFTGTNWTDLTDGGATTLHSHATPATVTVANEATDTTCFIGFFTAATGDLGPKTNANLTFNSSTGVLTLVAPVLGTPTSGTLTNCTGLPVSTGISGLGSNVATFLATPSSANLASAVTDETGTGALVFATSPTLVTPVLGAATATSIVVSSLFTAPGVVIPYAGSQRFIELDNPITDVDADGLTISAGSAAAGTGTNRNGGSIVMNTGDSTGSGSSTWTVVTAPSGGVGGTSARFAVTTGIFSSGQTTCTLDLGVAGTRSGNLKLEGSTSGYALLVPTAAAGSVTITLPATTGTVALTANNLSVFAATTSAQLAGVISDETGSGALVFATSPTLVTPVLGAASATTVSVGTATNLQTVHAYQANGTATSAQFLAQNDNATSGSAGYAFQVAHNSETTAYAPKWGIVVERTGAYGTGPMYFYANNTADASTFATGTKVVTIFGSGGVNIGAPTGGDKGAGTLNATGVYDDNTLLSDFLWDLRYDGKVRPEDEGLWGNARLWSIEETEQFTREHRHMPSMPGREQWKAGSRSLGELVTALWQTVEHQQMQIIDLHRRLSERDSG